MPINAAGSQFNTTLFNETTIAKPSRLKQIYTPAVLPETYVPTVRTAFNTTQPQSFTTKPVVRPIKTISGTFALVEAAKTLEYYRLDLYNSDALLNAVFPKTAQSEILYSDFLLFNYLPPELTPTEEQFVIIVSTPEVLVNLLPPTPVVLPSPEIPPTPFAATLCEVLNG